MYRKTATIGIIFLLLFLPILATSIAGKNISVVSNKLGKMLCHNSSLTLDVNAFDPNNCWALIVSVDYKDNDEDKPYSQKDFKVKDNLISHYWLEDHIRMIVGKDANKENIKSVFYNWLVKNSKNEDTIFMYFHAHGYKCNPVYPYWPPGGLCQPRTGTGARRRARGP